MGVEAWWLRLCVTVCVAYVLAGDVTATYRSIFSYPCVSLRRQVACDLAVGALKALKGSNREVRFRSAVSLDVNKLRNYVTRNKGTGKSKTN